MKVTSSLKSFYECPIQPHFFLDHDGLLSPAFISHMVDILSGFHVNLDFYSSWGFFFGNMCLSSHTLLAIDPI
jgi:hypothetical protein